MEAKRSGISDILNGARMLEIPFFQRSYVWKEEQWKRMLSDMENICKKNKPYFLGSLILKQKLTTTGEETGDCRTIIDGQQRLTTLALMLKALSLKKKDETIVSPFFLRFKPVLCIIHNYNDKATFEKIMQADQKPEIGSKPNRIEEAFEFFYENIDIAKIDFTKIIYNVFFIGIDLNIDEDEQQIFDTINSLGVKLSTGELLKNRFFDSSKIDFYENTWKKTFEDDEDCINYWNDSVSIGRNSVTMMDNFLYSYLQVKMHDPKLKGQIDSEKKKEFRRFENIFNSYIQLQKMLETVDVSIYEFISEIIEYAKIFHERFNKEILSSVVIMKEPSLDRLLVLMYGLEVMTIRPFLLYIEKNVEEEAERNKIYQYLESYLIRRFICKSNNNNYSDLFTENMIGQGINSYKKLKDYIEIKKPEDSLSIPNDASFKLGFSDTKMKDNTKAKTVLYLMETKIRDEGKQSTQLMAFNNYSLEHLMPKKWRNHWNTPALSMEDAAKRDEKILTMGNFAIISSPLNSSISDDEWAKKLEGRDKNKGLKYYSSGIETMGNVCEKTYWNESEIENRAQWLADKAVSIWS